MNDVLDNAPSEYLEYYNLVTESKNSGDSVKLCEARECFKEEFPLVPSIWLDWIEDEIANSNNNSEKIENLFENALKDFHAVSICVRYINWSVSIGMDYAIKKLERLIEIIGTHPTSASLIWDSYLDILTAIYESIIENSNETKEKIFTQIVQVYERALKIPQSNITELYERYVNFVGENNISLDIKSSYDKALKIFTCEIKEFEDNLVSQENKIEAYAQYIAYELNKNCVPQIQALYERAIVEFPFEADLWLQYATWLDSRNISSLSVYDRACKLCYSCLPLWQQSLLALERHNVEYDELITIWESGKAAIQSEEDCTSFYRTYIYLTHRYLTKTNAKNLSSVEELFDEAFKFIDEEYGGCGYESIQFRKNYAYYLYSKLKKPEKARVVWKDILTKSGEANKAWLWLEHINMERHFGDLVNTRRLFYTAINSVSDKPHEIFTAVVQFEREEGTLEELDKAIEKVNSQALRLSQIQQNKFKKGKDQKKQNNFVKKRSLERDENDYLNKKPKMSLNYSKKKEAVRDEDGFIKPLLPVKNVQKKTLSFPNNIKIENSPSAEFERISIKNKELDEAKNYNSHSNNFFKYSSEKEEHKLFVRNVDFTTTEDELKEHFSKYGNVLNVRIVTHKDGTPKGVAYVEYASAEEAQKGLKANDTKLHKRKLKIFISDPPPKGQKRNDFRRPNLMEERPTTHLARASRLSMVPRSLSKFSKIEVPISVVNTTTDVQDK